MYRHKVVAAWQRRHLTTGGKHFTAIATARIRDRYMTRPECQDTWIGLHLDTARQRLLDSAFFAERPALGNVAVQVKPEHGSATDHAAFTASDLGALLPEQTRATMYVVGTSSHVGAEIARWAVGGSLKNTPRIVVPCDEEITGGARPMLLQRLQEITNEPQIDEALLIALLEGGRVVPFFDGLSERSSATKTAIRAFLAETRVALAIITSRDHPARVGGANIVIEPKPALVATVTG